MSESIKKLILEEKWRRWHMCENIHVRDDTVEEDITNAARPKAKMKQQADSEKTGVVGRPGPLPDDDTHISKVKEPARRLAKPEDSLERNPNKPERTPSRDPKSDELTDTGKAAMKVNTIWTNNLAQLINFQAGKQLASVMGKQVAEQLGVGEDIGQKIADAVMKQTLETLDDLASKETEESFPGLFDATRS